MEDREALFVCVYKKDPHIPDSILIQCCKCGAEIWVAVHNADKKCICKGCIPKGQVDFYVTKEDLERSMEEIAKINKERDEKNAI